ncbi:MAG TPA: LCP family protein [Actinomycetota bacterium]|nr:LCP family protein [Actinomycetota bacterium]
MKRLLRAAPALAVAALLAANAGAGLLRPRAAAQTPGAEIHRVQEATFTPGRDRKRPIVILALGSDARPGEPVNRLRSDSIHIVAINPSKGGGTIIGFPRDSYVTIPGRGQARINEAMFYGGPQLTVKTVESITKIPIDYYVLTSFPGLIKIVRGIGGVPIEIKYRMEDEASGTDFKRGKKKLSGPQALAFTRDRHSAPGGDFGRSENQGRLMVAALKKLGKEFRKHPGVILRWIRVGMENIQSDLGLGEVFALMTTATQIKASKVKNVVVPGGTGDVGGASVVFISGGAQPIYDDVRDDGLLNRS